MTIVRIAIRTVTIGLLVAAMAISILAGMTPYTIAIVMLARAILGVQ